MSPLSQSTGRETPAHSSGGNGTASTDGVCGYSVLEAGSADEVETILDGHPHLAMPGGSIEVLEIVPINDL